MRGKKSPLTPFGKLVVNALTEQDMTQQQLAWEIGIKPQYLSSILHGVRSGDKHIPAIVATLSLDQRKVDRLTAA